MGVLLSHTDNGVTTVTLNRPDQHLIDYTLDQGLEQGLAEESRLSKAHGANVSASSLEARRGQVIDAGRQTSKNTQRTDYDRSTTRTD